MLICHCIASLRNKQITAANVLIPVTDVPELAKLIPIAHFASMGLSITCISDSLQQFAKKLKMDMKNQFANIFTNSTNKDEFLKESGMVNNNDLSGLEMAIFEK
ncbi:hypothetical protein RhiirC2_791840 [Rhizophagus irregularis]|uniref:Uncharacterized protein n=1 Tax=Rhizophagus irregularis TaxID=588596 RepID=A0A2N1MIE3_9GLOM|nr:hypothetical protein RhiirC2_791840 [Rhizophagus irregularis]